MEELKKNFKVVVRIRPPLPRELDGSRAGGSGALYRDIVRTEERGRAVTICENGIAQPGAHSIMNPDGSMTSTTSGGTYASHKFTFDYVYDQDAQQSDVYSNTARDAVMSTLQGYNATILGQCFAKGPSLRFGIAIFQATHVNSLLSLTASA